MKKYQPKEPKPERSEKGIQNNGNIAQKEDSPMMGLSPVSIKGEFPTKSIEEVVKGFRCCYDTNEGFKRGCAECPYEKHPLPHCMKVLQSDVLEYLKKRML